MVLVNLDRSGPDWVKSPPQSTPTSVPRLRPLVFSLSLDLLSDEPLFLLELPGSLLSQPGDLVETDACNTVDARRETR